MQSFDVCLEPPHGASFDAGVIFSILESNPHVHRTRDDRGRWIYRNEDTSVHFVILVHPEVVASYRRARAAEMESDEDWNPEANDGGPDVLGIDDEGDSEDGWKEDDEDDENDEEDEDQEDSEEHGARDESGFAGPLEMTPLVLSVPLFRPGFFITELEEVLSELLQKLGPLELHVAEDPSADIAPESDDSGDGRGNLVEEYRRLHASVAEELTDPRAIVRWTEERSRNFHAYARARGEIARALESEEVDVPSIHPARTGNDVVGLCVWTTDRSTVLPRCDRVLLREVRTKRGLFGKRRVVDERVVSGAELWNVLAPHSEYRERPVPHLVFRRMDPLSLRLLDALEGLAADPSGARRTELVGVVDFDIPGVDSDADGANGSDPSDGSGAPAGAERASRSTGSARSSEESR